MIVFLIFLLGLVVGSFLAALTYRMPKNVSILRGRSKCPNCSAKIAWYDNIPLMSFLFLGGRCRSCKKKISVRYPLIEAGTAALFVFTFMASDAIGQNIGWLTLLPDYLFYLIIFILISISTSILIIDLEHQIIPDELVFGGLVGVIGLILLTGFPRLWENVLASAASGLFLLALHVFTRGRGMGLGDVKLALFLGLVLGLSASVIWIFGSFILGGAVAMALLLTGKAHLGQRIPFGPFLISAFLLVTFFGGTISRSVFPY